MLNAGTDHRLEHVRVREVMHHGILSCAADAPLADVAGMLARHRVHAVAISATPGGRPDGVVSDLDVVGAVASGAEPSAAETAATEPLTISADAPLIRAAQLMSEHRVSHVVVIDPAGGFPVGMLSSLDIAAAYAGHP